MTPANAQREALIEALQGSAELTALVPRIYPNTIPSNPVKPYSRLGPAEAEPERLSGWTGAEYNGAVHVFAAPTEDNPDAEAFVNEALAVMFEVIEGLPDAFVDRTMNMPDARESEVRHGILYYRMTVAKKA